MKRFKIKSVDSNLWYWVIVYPDLKELIKAANKHDKKCGTSPDNEGVAGLCHSFTRESFDDKGAFVKRHENIGIIRLAKDRLTTEIVSHEVIHAAFWTYRLEFGTEREWEGSIENADFGNGCGESEERLAYLYGQYFTVMTRKLYKYGFWN